MGPKCSSCGTVGHNKNSKVCPNYYSAEAVQRREVWYTQLIYRGQVSKETVVFLWWESITV